MGETENQADFSGDADGYPGHGRDCSRRDTDHGILQHQPWPTAGDITRKVSLFATLLIQTRLAVVPPGLARIFSPRCHLHSLGLARRTLFIGRAGLESIVLADGLAYHRADTSETKPDCRRGYGRVAKVENAREARCRKA